MASRNNATTDTTSPKHIVPTSTRTLINQFFATMDISDTAAGGILASSICSEDCILLLATQKFEGTRQIEGCRQNAWNGVQSRKHVLTDLFVSENQANQFIVMGTAEMKFSDGTDKVSEFVGQFVISYNQGGDPRVQIYRVWLAPDIA